MQTKLKFIIAASAALACATAANAQSAGSFILNAGWTYVVPKTNSYSSNGHDMKIKTSGASALGLSGTYFVTDNIAGELALSTPARLTLKSGYADGSKIGSVKQFSPALLVKYYFLNAEDKFRPYVGAGVSRVSFKNAKPANALVSFDLKNKWAPVANAGFTYQFTDQLFGGVAVSYMPVNAGKMTIIDGAVTHTAKVKIDPITTFVSLGYKF